ncbi:hypothetical protein Tco_1417132, partial [Tanacetum coccineum]
AEVVYPNPPTDDSEACPLKELSIKFTVKNGTKIDIGEIIYSDLVTRLMNKSRKKYISYPRFISCALDWLLGSNNPWDQRFRSPPHPKSIKFSKNPSEVTPIELTAFMTNVINRENLLSPLPVSKKTREKKKTQTVTKPKPKSQGLEAKHTNPQNTKGNIQFDVKGLLATNPNEVAGTKYQVDQTKSTRFEVSDPDHNEGKTSSEVEPDTEPFILNTFREIQALLEDSKEELKDESDEEMYEVGEEIDEEEPTSTEQQSPSLNKDHPESSKAKKSDNSPDASDSESSSCFETFKPFENYVPVTERVLVRNLQGFSEEVQNAIKEDHVPKKKVLEATEAYTKNSTNLAELITLVKNFNFLGFKTTIESSGYYTTDIKAIMTEMFYAFKGQSLSTPSSSVPEPTLAITGVPANVRG